MYLSSYEVMHRSEYIIFGAEGGAFRGVINLNLNAMTHICGHGKTILSGSRLRSREKRRVILIFYLDPEHSEQWYWFHYDDICFFYPSEQFFYQKS